MVTSPTNLTTLFQIQMRANKKIQDLSKHGALIWCSLTNCDVDCDVKCQVNFYVNCDVDCEVDCDVDCDIDCDVDVDVDFFRHFSVLFFLIT